jgi:DNA-binding NarL/FixJ family response regulator
VPELLEREGELGELQSALEDARDGRGRLVLVEGPAGIGKTRLLEAARETAGRTGMQVLHARGTELERDFPFALVRQLFEPVLHAAGEANRDELLDGAAGLAGPVVGIEAGASVGAAEPLADPSFAILNALYWLTSNLAESDPILLAVDDAHWADQPSLRFFRFLLTRLEDLALLLALAARPSEPGAQAELLAQLTTDPATRVVRPPALSKDAVSEMVRAGLASNAHDDFCVACHEATAGNPFMLGELIRELAADGSSGTAGEAVRVRQVAPATIGHAVLVRLARLPEDAQQLARAVAILGDDAEPRQTAALAGLDRDAAAEAADALATVGILEAGRPLRFVHPLVRNAVYADLPSAERSAAHRAAARLLEHEGAQPERIAVHLLAADPDDDSAVVETLNAAARRALDRGAPEAAIAYLRRALREPPHPDARRDLLRHLTTASLFTMDRGMLEDLQSDVVEELTAVPQMLMASAAELAPLLLTYGRGSEGLALMERAIDAAIDAEDYDLVIRFEAQTVIWAHLPPAKGAARWDAYKDRIASDSPGERLWLTMKAFSGTFAGEPASTVAELARRAVEGGAIFREELDGVLSSNPIYVLLRADELEVAERAIEQYWSEARARGPALTAGTAFLRADLAHARGDIARAEPDARAAVEAGRQGGFLVAFPNWLALLVDVLIERGELDGAQRELEASGMDGSIPDDYWFTPLLHSRACLRLAQGSTGEGLADLLEAGRRVEPYEIKNTTLVPIAAVAATALAGSGQQEPARDLAEMYLSGAHAWGTARAIGIGLHALGMVKGGAEGIELLREAVATLERSHARLEHAKALTDLGAALRRANRRSDAREPLRLALEMARRGGALAVATRAHQELEATGEKLRPLMATGVESLTPSERRVAELAAAGQSNREIAQALFLTVKTVEAHLSHAYRKLDIGSRSELPRILEGAGDAGARGI